MAQSDLQILNDLIFFSEKGIEIPMKKIYTITWEIIPNTQVANNFISNPKGHFIYDLVTENDTPIIEVIIDDPGKIINCETIINFTNDYNNYEPKQIILNNIKDIIVLDKTSTYEKLITYKKNRFTGEYIPEHKTITENIYNRVKITFNTLSETIEKYYPINFVFTQTGLITTEVPGNLTYHKLTTIKLAEADAGQSSQYKNIILGLIDTNFIDYNTLFPCIKYIGQLTQDKISTDLIAVSTIIIVKPRGTDTAVFSSDYSRPHFTNYQLYFEFQKDSEMKFISENSIDELIWKDSYLDSDINTEFYTDMHDGTQSIIRNDFNTNNQINNNRPIYFSVGFLTEIEGCYQNVMAIYLKPKNSNNEKYLVGLLTFLTEVEGEDERYRALLGNLGIPDPITYPNIFFQQDVNEEGVNWELVNNKSKELMLTYDQIFPYAGTYKALFGAINFLGYQDLIFKEWYKIKDQYNRDKFVTIQTFDLQKNESLIPKLKQTYVNFGDFERYKKLNKLTMIYHLNELNETDGEYLDIYFKRKDIEVNSGPTTGPESGLFKSFNPTLHYPEFNEEFNEPYNYEPYSAFFDLPFTTRIYEFRTTELLAKLHAVKLWLEKYILGVNCYISDICGEGIIVERLKTQAYVTEHQFQDFTAEIHATPKITNITDFNDSSAIITCSLNEYNTLTFDDYKNVPIYNFIRKTINLNTLNTNIYISNPIGALIQADEYEFILENKDTSIASLIEFTDTSYINNPILIHENELLFFNDSQNITKIAKNELPMIEIRQGNLRYCHGNWENNIKYTINLAEDQNTGNQYYFLYDNEFDDTIYKGYQKVILYPYIPNDLNVDLYQLFWVYGEDIDKTNDNYIESYEGKDSEMIYTAYTKWNVPMLIIRNYICGNTKNMLNGDFILEIIEGNIVFRNHKYKIDDGKCVGCNIKFGQEFDSFEQLITASFTYISDRTPIYIYDTTALLNNLPVSEEDLTDDYINQYLTVNTHIPIKVNRIGEYSVSVKAYNTFNNIFFNQSDKTYFVNSNPIDIDIIINTEQMFNEKDFFDKNKTGKLLTIEEKENLFSKLNQEPIAPQSWRIYDIDTMLDSSNEIIYNNISYAIDTPKIGDFIIFNNFTEKITYIEKITNDNESVNKEYIIKLLDENPNKDTIKNASHIGLCIYDNIQKNIIADIYPLNVVETSILDTSKYRYDINNSFIKVTEDDDLLYENTELTLSKLSELCINSSLLDSSNYFLNSIQGYIYNADEILIENPFNDISINYLENKTYITDVKQHFIKNQVIKICYADEIEIHNHYTKNVIDNETTFRIIDVSLFINEETQEQNCIYILDGLFDFYKLNNKLYHNKAEYVQDSYNQLIKLNIEIPYKIKLCSAHLRAAQYILRVDTSGEELYYQYNYGTESKVKVRYANKPLLFDSYLDTTYSAYILEYDPDYLKNIWINPKTIWKEIDNLYSYKNFPVTLSKNRTVILQPNPEQNRLINVYENYEKENNNIILKQYNTPFKTIWTWKTFIIDDQDNWHGHEDLVGKQTIFKSVNNILTIKTELLGTQTTQMDCIDIYGNRLRNHGEGSMYIYGDGKNIINREEQETRNIYYKDIYIVGFESFSTLSNIIMTQGETTTIINEGTNDTYGADKNSNVNHLITKYKIYYNDGTILENKGADIQLLTTKGNLSKSNKITMKISESKYPHKHSCGTISGIIKIQKPNKRDLIKPEIKFNLELLQYGYAKTISINNLTFTVNDIPKEGIENLTTNIISDLITNIKYTSIRSNGEIETIEANTLNDAYLKIISYIYSDNNKGHINYIDENINNFRKNIGLLSIIVQFDVRGIIENINTFGKAQVYIRG